jgi:hypothetical protein
VAMAKNEQLLTNTIIKGEEYLWFKLRKNNIELSETAKRIEWYIINTISSENLLDLLSEYNFENSDIDHHKPIATM